MRRVTALCAAAAVLLSTSAAFARAPASGYYVIRWDNTGVCQVWNTNMSQKPVRWPSDYKVVSTYVPTFTAAATIQEKMRMAHRCTL